MRPEQRGGDVTPSLPPGLVVVGVVEVGGDLFGELTPGIGLRLDPAQGCHGFLVITDLGIIPAQPGRE